MKNLQGKRVFITGAAGGIGLETSALFAEAGAHLILTDINLAGLADAKDRLAKYNISIETHAIDATDKNRVEALAAVIEKRLGGIDILINNAGVGFNAELADTGYETWVKLMNINFWAPLYHIYSFLPGMKKRKSGSIVNISSGQAFFRAPTWGAYSVAKLAIGAFSEILHTEVARDNIKVTTVYPYLVNTGFYDNAQADSLSSMLFFAFMPLYSHKPDQVAELIFKAVKNESDVEMVSIFNQFFKFFRVIPPLAKVVDKSTLAFMSKAEQENLKEKSLLNHISGFLGNIFSAIESKAPGVGFQIHEVMSGEHEFTAGNGPEGKLKMEFRADWGTSNLAKWINPAGEAFMTNELSGFVTVEGLCENIPCKGTLELRYFTDQKIRYTFQFTANGQNYTYVGEKSQIYPWNLAYSHTTCFGEIKRNSDGAIISKSITHFDMDTMPDFLSSFKLVS